MATPTNREEFKDFILRKLGAPVIEINVDETQLDDRIDEALKYFADYHYDGSEVVYYRHQLSQEDFDRRYIQLPDNIIGAVRIFDLGSSLTAGGMFNIQYQIALNDLYSLTAQSMIPYFMTMQHLELLQQILVGKQPIRYNRLAGNRVHVDMNWDKVKVGSFLVFECYQVVDPEEFQKVWADRWLQRYTTALVGVQWANNLSKFQGMQLPGGVQFNGDGLMARYMREQNELESEMLFGYGLPPMDMLG